VYYDPESDDELEAQQATLPLDVQRRMVSLDLAVKAYASARRVQGTSSSVNDAFEKVVELAEIFEQDLLREERRWELRNRPYDEYLQTCEWYETRAAARVRAGERCQVCNRSGPLDVHHRTYERRGQEREDDLTVLCRECHELFHRYGRLS
jgi:HNH endonuclease